MKLDKTSLKALKNRNKWEETLAAKLKWEEIECYSIY